jgi:hypothetical protein
MDLVAGWNAVYLHVDAGHEVFDDLMAAAGDHPIEEVWQWNPSVPAAQFSQDPAQPSATGTPWSTWKRGFGADATLLRASGNRGYLVRVATDVPTYQWDVKGKPVAPSYDWTTTGLNFIGFPTVADAPPTWETFLLPVPGLLHDAEIYRYVGGPLGANNPQLVEALNSLTVRRGEAYWMRAGDLYNRYFGPFSLELPVGSGLEFGDSTSAQSLRVRNLTPAVLTVRLELVDSETPPTGQAAIEGPPPMLIRQSINTTNLTFGHTNFATAQLYTLQPAGRPGSEVEIVLGMDRAQMVGDPGDLYAAMIRITDSRNLTRVDLPVSAAVTSQAGLWVGAAAITQVRHYLRQYEKDAEGALVLNDEGKYVVESVKEDLGTVARPFPLRLILHTDATGGNGRLLQRVYVGPKADGNSGLTTRESLLDTNRLVEARRISVTHLPWSEANVPWNCTGTLRSGQTLATSVALDHADTTAHPFLHTYHPDHDNLNATFDARTPRGEESYDVIRQITLSVLPPDDDFNSRTRGHNVVTGEYAEVITLTGTTKPGRPQPESRTFESRGIFSLTRLTDEPVLTTE